MSKRIKVKGFEFDRYDLPSYGEYFMTQAGYITTYCGQSIEKRPIFKPKKKTKWVDATKELIQSQGYKWGEPVPCRYVDMQGKRCSDNRELCFIGDYQTGFPFIDSELGEWANCQIKVEV